MAVDFESKFKKEFRITDILGEGAYGCVFEVNYRKENAIYAVKRIPVESENPNALKNAMKEVRAMAQLDHHGIVRYHGSWNEKPPLGWQSVADNEMLKDTPYKHIMHYKENSAFIYIQMQRCDHSLEAWLKANTTQSSRPLPLMKTWFKQMVSAVAYIHEKGLIHRDLKPCNILFVKGNVKICDLGIATEIVVIDGEEISVTRTCIGTQTYMSPEQQAVYSKYSSKSDVFTLGLILAELCVALTSEQRTKLFHQFRRGKQGNFEHPEAASIVGMLTQKMPEDRPTCNELLNHPFFK